MADDPLRTHIGMSTHFKVPIRGGMMRLLEVGQVARRPLGAGKTLAWFAYIATRSTPAQDDVAGRHDLIARISSRDRPKTSERPSTMIESRRFGGVTALVTGAGQGIGRACVGRLAAEGARMAVSDLDLDLARSAADELPESAGRVALRLDVTDRASVDGAVAAAAVELGGLDVVVNVAGGDLPHGVFEEIGDEIWSALLELNLVGVARVCRAAIPFLRRSSRSPAIVTVSSINGQAALGGEPYSSAKAGLTSLTANLARSLAADGVRVNAVAPGTIRTRVWDGQEGGADRMLPLYPLGRVGEPNDVAAAVAFLASVDAAWITGHVLPVDGGLLLARPSV
jgi:meso-butanediol dehydrogenase / (S,S)-butanediol dehydrogenase / diacetyl reductase